MPQRKKTSPTTAAELPDLTGQQHEFVRHICSGKTATDAYRLAYDCSSMAQTTIWAAASRLRSDCNVAAWIDAAKIAGLADHSVTYQGHLEELDRLKALCIKSGNLGAAVVCEQTRGKVGGLHIERVQEVPIDPVQTLKDIAAHQPDVAASLAEQAGIPWADIDPSSRTLN
ncbi:MAG TPA: hypothetical protein VFI87_12045 [Hyphomicrobiaceae bacterium]|nr:hypothetical protein [Hyphomicrobiaceae bacterium]